MALDGDHLGCEGSEEHEANDAVKDHASRTNVESKGCHAVVGDQCGE